MAVKEGKGDGVNMYWARINGSIVDNKYHLVNILWFHHLGP